MRKIDIDVGAERNNYWKRVCKKFYVGETLEYTNNNL